MSSPSMLSFVLAVHDRLLTELDKNRTVDVFKDEFALDDDDDEDNSSSSQAAAGAVDGS